MAGRVPTRGEETPRCDPTLPSALSLSHLLPPPFPPAPTCPEAQEQALDGAAHPLGSPPPRLPLWSSSAVWGQRGGGAANIGGTHGPSSTPSPAPSIPSPRCFHLSSPSSCPCPGPFWPHPGLVILVCTVGPCPQSGPLFLPSQWPPRPDLFPSPTTWTCPAEPAGHKAPAPASPQDP